MERGIYMRSLFLKILFSSFLTVIFVGIAIVLGIFTRPLALLFCAFTLGTALIGHRY